MTWQEFEEKKKKERRALIFAAAKLLVLAGFEPQTIRSFLMGQYADAIQSLEDRVTTQAATITAQAAQIATLTAEVPDAADIAKVQGVPAFLNPPAPAPAPVTPAV